MSLLTYTELTAFVESGVIRGVHKGHINGASIDLTLGSKILVEAPPAGSCNVVDLMDKQVPAMREVDLLKTGYFDLAPFQFCLAASIETFFLPNNIIGEFKLKSSLARAGLNHALAGHCDPGWTGSVLTLELKNMLRWHSLRLRPGQKIGQVILHRGTPVPDHASYAATGQYNGHTSAQQSLGVR